MQLPMFDELPRPEISRVKPRFHRKRDRFGGEPKQLSIDVEKLLDSLQDVEWKDEHILIMKDWLLCRSLEIIRNKAASTSSFAEEVAWIYEQQEDWLPFSARKCAESSGLDIERIRSGLYGAVSEEKRQIIRLLGFQPD
ncbi:hypothetical protein [Thalassolituus marinus]|nr:hypothetical protein [Thalassolituus marinus]